MLHKLVLAVTVAAVFTVTACTPQAQKPAAPRQSAPSATANDPATPETSTRSEGLTILTCMDSNHGEKDSPSVNGISSRSLSGTDAKPRDIFSLKGPNGHRYLLWKTFLNVAPSARPYRTITVIRPSTARLYYADAQTWGTAPDAKKVTDARRRVRFSACGNTYSGYTGGIIVAEPACVTLQIASPHERSHPQIVVPIAKAHC